MLFFRMETAPQGLYGGEGVGSHYQDQGAAPVPSRMSKEGT
jgi:deoxycytidine triphosphate deaminase